MAGQFVPFMQTLKTRPKTAPENGSQFAPMGAAEPKPETPPPCGEVKIELKREGGQVREIHVHCKCGEVIELACEY